MMLPRPYLDPTFSGDDFPRISAKNWGRDESAKRKLGLYRPVLLDSRKTAINSYPIQKSSLYVLVTSRFALLYTGAKIARVDL